MGLIQEWALLDGARRNLCQFVILDKCRILAPRGKASIRLVLLPRRCLMPLKGRPCGQGRCVGFRRITELHLLYCIYSFYSQNLRGSH